MERLAKLTKALSGLAAAAKHHFYVSKWVTLGMTPLEALADEGVKDILTGAACFAVR